LRKYNFEEEQEKYRGRKIIDTKHSIERYIQRYVGQISKTTVEEVFKKVIDEIFDRYKDKIGEYGFHSKSTGIGGVCIWRREGDPRFDDGNYHFIIKSLFPIKKFHTYNNVDPKIIVEKHVIEWAKEKGFTGKRVEGLCENFSNIDYEDYHEYDFSVFFYEGKLHDFYLDGYILID